VPSAPSASATTPWHGCSPGSWQDGPSLNLPAGSHSTLMCRTSSRFLGTSCAGGRPAPQTTGRFPAVGPGVTTVKGKVTLRLTASQSVGLGVVPHLGHMNINLFIYFSFRTVTVFFMRASSLTRSRVCRLSVSPLCDVFVRIIYNIFTKYIKYNRVKCLMNNIYKSSVSPGSVQQIMPYC
jgi:hypothetical protein